MKHIVTAFISRGSIDWTAGLPLRHLVALLDELSDVLERFTIVTDSDALPRTPPNADVVRIAPPTGDHLPHLADSLGIGGDEEVLVVDVRNLFLTGEHVAAFLRAYRTGDAPMTTVTQATRSPFYFKRLLTLSMAGSLHLFDPGRDVSGFDSLFDSPTATHPFPFDWQAPGLDRAEPGDAFAPRIRGNEVSWQPVGQLSGDARPSCLIIREGERDARAVMERKDRMGAMLPLSHLDECDLTATRSGDTWIFQPRASMEKGELEVVPFTMDGPRPDLRRTLPLRDGTWTMTLPPDCRPAGFLFHATEAMSRGVPSIIRKFDNSTLWENGNGQPITGRQQLPTVLCVSGELMAGRCKELVNLNESLAAGKVRAHHLPCPSIIVSGLEDLMWTRAHMKAGSATCTR